MSQDFDNDIGFWIKNVPYVWVNGKTIEECKRFYILDSNKFIAVFDENNFIVRDPETVKNKLVEKQVKEDRILSSSLEGSPVLKFQDNKDLYKK